MANADDDYSKFVVHPRFGQQPRLTGLNPDADFGGEVFIHWHSPKESRIPNTAIPADLSRQSPATVPVTHYFDVKRRCRDCGKSFIFFAEEQKYWYEELGFALEADCVRCVACRKKQRGIEQERERYEELFHVADRSVDQNLEMAECCLALIEASVFHKRQLERVRMLLKRMPSDLSGNSLDRLKRLRARLSSRETEPGS